MDDLDKLELWTIESVRQRKDGRWSVELGGAYRGGKDVLSAEDMAILAAFLKVEEDVQRAVGRNLLVPGSLKTAAQVLRRMVARATEAATIPDWIPTSLCGGLPGSHKWDVRSELARTSKLAALFSPLVDRSVTSTRATEDLAATGKDDSIARRSDWYDPLRRITWTVPLLDGRIWFKARLVIVYKATSLMGLTLPEDQTRFEWVGVIRELHPMDPAIRNNADELAAAYETCRYELPLGNRAWFAELLEAQVGLSR